MLAALLIVGAVYAFGLPLTALFLWNRKHPTGLKPFFCGMAAFVLFVYVLEGAANYCVLTLDGPVSRWMAAHPLMTVLYAALAAGVFEETARLIVFKTVLKKRETIDNAVTYGIGHAGVEAVLTLGITYVVYLAAALSGFSGSFASAAAIVDVIQPFTVGLAMLERFSAMLLHIALSMIVFTAARKEDRRFCYPLAILLHGLADTPAVLYQLFRLPVLIIEAFTLLYAAAVLAFAVKYIKRIYGRDIFDKC